MKSAEVFSGDVPERWKRSKDVADCYISEPRYGLASSIGQTFPIPDNVVSRYLPLRKHGIKKNFLVVR